MSILWPQVLRRIGKQADAFLTTFYYRKYFEWGLPARRFVQVNIETNTICNRSCHFCLYGIKDEVPANPMPVALFFDIIDQLVAMDYSGRLSLFCINEPLTDKRIYDFTRYVSLMLPHCFHVLVSNGDILTRERLALLFENGLDLLLINSYDEPALQKNRVLYDEALQRYPGKILHTDRTIYHDWVSRAGHIEQYFKGPVRGYCDLPNYALYIKPDGKVLSCCHDFDEQNVVGDLTRQSILEAWRGEQFQALRRRLNRGDRSGSELCGGCDHEPDLDYFKWNHRLPEADAKRARGLPKRAGAADLVAARAIKEKLLERERRRSQNKRAARAMPPAEAALG